MRWKIKNDINNGILIMLKKSWIDIPLPIGYIGKTGASFSRQNYYFKSLAEGKQKLIIRYEDSAGRHPDTYRQMTLNILTS